ncbi:hypothetical protein AL486_09950 [Pandoraea apista]|uniref:hypothetical protein n=1 Tax=Pandoraea apista TaxID=93218 RepID=UPI000CE9765D|nr:hypothetical protein [Pandoraea apista]AVF39992.1 hypothetical protein AL486_09950 [Pandoraea apista]
MKNTSPRYLTNPEVVANLWVYADEDGYIFRLAGKAYVLDGNDEEKLAILRMLSATDFLSAAWVPVPANFSVTSSAGEEIRAAQLSQLSYDLSSQQLVGPLLDKLAADIPEQAHASEDGYSVFSMKMPEDPLTVLTVVIEQSDGRLVPLLTNHQD